MIGQVCMHCGLSGRLKVNTPGTLYEDCGCILLHLFPLPDNHYAYVIKSMWERQLTLAGFATKKYKGTISSPAYVMARWLPKWILGLKILEYI